MKRSQSSSTTNINISPRRTLFPRNGGNGGWDLGGGAQAATIGRSLLDRPRSKLCNDDGHCVPDALLLDATFSASAAKAPIRRVSTDLTLKSCLSSGGNSSQSMLSRSKSYTNHFKPQGTSHLASKNEEFNLVRNVSFSHIQVREYEVTLGDNPSVSSGAPLSLGWRYNPQENISSLSDGSDADPAESSPSRSTMMRRSRSELRLSDRERHRRLSANPNISMKELHEVLQSVATARLERKESLNEFREQMQKLKQQKMDELLIKRGMMRRRRVWM